MGIITQLIDSYAEGDSTFEELKEALADVELPTPETWKNRPTDPAELEAHIDEHIQSPMDSWSEVLTARAQGKLTREQYLELNATRAAS